MKKFIYTNPTFSWITINGENVYLEQGKSYELPSDNAYIAALIEQGYLVPAPTSKLKIKSEK
jgi:hypothetical protein